MSDLRERFERHQAGLLNIDYEELKDQFDRHEEIFGKRYVTFSDFEKEFELWQACWNHQQAKIEKLENELSTTKQVLGNVIDMEVAKVDNLKAQLNNMETCYIGIKKINDEQSAIIQGHFAARQDMQMRIDEYKKLTVSIRNEFDLWSDDSEFADVIEAQIENLEALRGAND